MVRIKDVLEINPRPAHLPDDTLVSFVPMKCVEEESGRFVSAGDKRVVEVRKGYTAFRDGDVIWAKVTPCMENGKAAVLAGLTNGVGYGSTEFFVLRPSAQLDSAYLLHFILQKNFRQKAAQHMTGAVGLRRVPKSFLEQQEIPLPPLDEQRRIVAEIEQQFTHLDAGVTALRRVQANLKRYRAAVLKAACEGRLVPTEAELAKGRARSPNAPKSRNANGGLGVSSDSDSPPTALPANANYETGEQLLQRILAERRKNWSGRGKYKEPTTPDTPNLPLLPKGWTWASPEQLSRDSSYGTSAKCSYENTGIPVLRIPNISAGKIDLSDLKFAHANECLEIGDELLPGDLLIIRTNGSKSLIGRSAVVRVPLPKKASYASYLIRFRLFENPILFSWFATIWDVSFLRAWVEQRAATSAGQHNISMSILATMPIPLPPLAEQARIVAEIECRLSIIDELETLIITNLVRAARLRQSILQQAFQTPCQKP